MTTVGRMGRLDTVTNTIHLVENGRIGRTADKWRVIKTVYLLVSGHVYSRLIVLHFRGQAVVSNCCVSFARKISCCSIA